LERGVIRKDRKGTNPGHSCWYEKGAKGRAKK